jgi:hypothetical protein
MSYAVIWGDAVQDEVQRLHDDAADPEAVLHAVVRIGLELSQVPLSAGESREGNRRILFKFPLVVWYTVHDRLKIVVVTDVGWSKRQ